MGQFLSTISQISTRLYTIYAIEKAFTAFLDHKNVWLHILLIMILWVIYEILSKNLLESRSMPYSILVLPDHSWLKNKYIMCLKLGCVSLLWLSDLVCKLGGTPLPVIGETEVKFMDPDALPVLVTKDFPRELLIGSDAISRGNGKIDYGTRKVTSLDQNFSITSYTDFIPHTASVWELLSPLHQWRHEGVYRPF